MRRAGLVAYGNRKNREPVPGIGIHIGEKRSDHHTSASVRQPWVGRAPRAVSARQHQGHLMGTHASGRRRAHRSAAKQRMVWDNAKVQRTEREESNVSKADTTTGQDRTAYSARRWSDRPPCCYKAMPGVHRADRGPLASRTRPQEGAAASRCGLRLQPSGIPRPQSVHPGVWHRPPPCPVSDRPARSAAYQSPHDSGQR
jgi:hypothetical protein